MATNNAINLGTAASGKVLQGQGVGTNSAFSTATYPATATTTGQILRADGTNWTGTTATFPNTAGSNGNVLTSDGTNWSSSAAPAGNLLIATKTLTSSQIKALHATPIEIIAAPGAGKGIAVLCSTAKLNYGGTNVFTAGASQQIGIYYNNNTTTISIAVVNTSTIVSSANKFCIQGAGSLSSFNQVAGVLDNVNVAAWNNVSTEISGNAAGDNTIDIQVSYYIVTF